MQEKKSIGRVNTCKEIIENKTTSTWISSFPCFLKLTAMRTLWNHDYRVNDVKCYHKFFNKPKSYIEDTLHHCPSSKWAREKQLIIDKYVINQHEPVWNDLYKQLRKKKVLSIISI